MVRLTYEEAVERLNEAAAALSQLMDPTAPQRVRVQVIAIDMIVGSAHISLADASDIRRAMAVARVTGSVRVALCTVRALSQMPEAAPYEADVRRLAAALEAFA